ncbi:MAG: prenyltransferase/squalene oxidase repeat-containing protein [Saccharofermentanales bacterium]
MADKVIEWLLEDNYPSVEYLTLTSLLEKPHDDPSVVRARENIMDYGLVPKILEKQNADGSWGDPERFYNDKYTGTSWVLLLLAELAADPDDKRIRNACEFILGNSQDPESGGFSYVRSGKTGAGLPSGVVPCLTGNMVYSMVKLGRISDPRVRSAIDWIVRIQRTDDAQGEAPAGKMYERYEMCWGRHSCHMGVAKAFKALSAIPPECRSDDIDMKTGEMAEYFLKHHIYKKSHDLNDIARPGWLKSGFPLMYQTDVLELLGIFAGLKIKDERLKDAINIIENKRMPDGRWKLENSFNGKTIVDIEKKGAPSKWITLKSMIVQKEYDYEK